MLTFSPIGIGLLVCATQSANADFRDWTSATDGDFEDPSNWAFNIPPLPNDTVVFLLEQHHTAPDPRRRTWNGTKEIL